MKKKTLAKSSRAIARLTANVDGKWNGLTQKGVETMFSMFVALETAIIVSGKYRSLALAVRKVSMRKAKAFKAKSKSLKKKAGG